MIPRLNHLQVKYEIMHAGRFPAVKVHQSIDEWLFRAIYSFVIYWDLDMAPWILQFLQTLLH